MNGNEELLMPLNEYSNVKRVIGVVSGKGGVGKSFVTSRLASIFSKKGYKTAVLDADITGPSVPRCFGLKDKVRMGEHGIEPAVTETGIRIMSTNLLLDNEEMPVIWRGPIIAGTVKQFWGECEWSDVEYMFVDMPPGTGDVPLTVFQSIPVDGIIIVTSPQELVSMIVKKAVNMANAMNIPVLGIVENYSFIKCPDCGKIIFPFGEGDTDGVGAEYGIPVLSRLPIDLRVAEAMDKGEVEKLDSDLLEDAAETIEYLLKDKALQKKKPLSEEADGKEHVIAMPLGEGGNILKQFGKADKILAVKVKGKEVLRRFIIEPEEISPEGVVKSLEENGADIFMCSVISPEGRRLLESRGISFVLGIKGNTEDVLMNFLAGKYTLSGK